LVFEGRTAGYCYKKDNTTEEYCAEVTVQQGEKLLHNRSTCFYLIMEENCQERQKLH
jgi:hypothetical protein